MFKKHTLFEISLLKLANPRIKLCHSSPEFGICRVGVAAVFFLHPFGAFEEAPHLLVVATVAEVADDVDEFVGLAVLAVPDDGRQLAFGSVITCQAIGEKGFHGEVVFDIASLGHIVDEISEKCRALVLDGQFEVQMLRVIGGAFGVEKVIRQGEFQRGFVALPDLVYQVLGQRVVKNRLNEIAFFQQEIVIPIPVIMKVNP